MKTEFTFTADALTGRRRDHVVQYDAPRFAAIPAAGAAFLNMRAAAAHDGFDLRPFSSFRDLKTQTRIWNRKFLLERPIYDRAGRLVDGAMLSEEKRVWAILGFSAAPGMSRHHWGTEIDVVDGAVVDAGHTVDLLPYETEPGGPFANLHRWLDDNIARFGFYRPYDQYRGGMFEEPWHLSFAPAATAANDQFELSYVREAFRSLDLAGGETLDRLLPEIYDRHVLNVATAPQDTI